LRSATPIVLLAAGITCALLAQADADTSNLDQVVAGVYNQVQARSPSMSPSFQRILWDPGYPYGGGGTGRIIDANPRLGGPFTVYPNLGPNPPGWCPLGTRASAEWVAARLLGRHSAVLLMHTGRVLLRY
jgi:hypothetical protein